MTARELKSITREEVEKVRAPFCQLQQPNLRATSIIPQTIWLVLLELPALPWTLLLTRENSGS